MNSNNGKTQYACYIFCVCVCVFVLLFILLSFRLKSWISMFRIHLFTLILKQNTEVISFVRAVYWIKCCTQKRVADFCLWFLLQIFSVIISFIHTVSFIRSFRSAWLLHLYDWPVASRRFLYLLCISSRKWNYVRNCYLIGVSAWPKNEKTISFLWRIFAYLFYFSWFSLSHWFSFSSIYHVKVRARRVRARACHSILCVSKSPISFSIFTTIFELWTFVLHPFID